MNSIGGNLVIIFGLVMVNAGLSGIEAPTRLAIIPSLVERRHLPSAFALNQTLSQTMAIACPALGGVVIGEFGTATAYAAAAVGPEWQRSRSSAW